MLISFFPKDSSKKTSQLNGGGTTREKNSQMANSTNGVLVSITASTIKAKKMLLITVGLSKVITVKLKKKEKKNKTKNPKDANVNQRGWFERGFLMMIIVTE